MWRGEGSGSACTWRGQAQCGLAFEAIQLTEMKASWSLAKVIFGCLATALDLGLCGGRGNGVSHTL